MSWTNIFTGGISKTIETIATEFIQTDLESAEAKSLMVKTLDPNGLMRRGLSKMVCNMYRLYLVVTMLLLACEFFGFVPAGQSVDAVAVATTKLTDLFLPISTAFGVILTASFGVNYSNVKQGK